MPRKKRKPLSPECALCGERLLRSAANVVIGSEVKNFCGACVSRMMGEGAVLTPSRVREFIRNYRTEKGEANEGDRWDRYLESLDRRSE
jgi:hypothetical protein